MGAMWELPQRREHVCGTRWRQGGGQAGGFYGAVHIAAGVRRGQGGLPSWLGGLAQWRSGREGAVKSRRRMTRLGGWEGATIAAQGPEREGTAGQEQRARGKGQRAMGAAVN